MEDTRRNPHSKLWSWESFSAEGTHWAAWLSFITEVMERSVKVQGPPETQSVVVFRSICLVRNRFPREVATASLPQIKKCLDNVFRQRVGCLGTPVQDGSWTLMVLVCLFQLRVFCNLNKLMGLFFFSIKSRKLLSRIFLWGTESCTCLRTQFKFE